MPITFEELLARKKAVTKVVDIVLDPALADELEEARHDRDLAKKLAEVRTNDSDTQARYWELEEKVAALERRLQEENLVAYFTFEAIGRAAFETIEAAHPAGAEQRAKMRRMGVAPEMANQVNWDEKTFPPAIVAACLRHIELPNGETITPTEEEVIRMWHSNTWNQAELSKLVVAAITVNGTARAADLGKGSRKMQPSGQS